ncbi:MAG: hypothetical protein ACP5VQ_07780, partial [Phycisphaerae bacterium]
IDPTLPGEKSLGFQRYTRHLRDAVAALEKRLWSHGLMDIGTVGPAGSGGFHPGLATNKSGCERLLPIIDNNRFGQDEKPWPCTQQAIVTPAMAR